MGVPAFIFFYKVEYSKYSLVPPGYLITLEDIEYNWTSIPMKIQNDETILRIISIFVFIYLILGFIDMIYYYLTFTIPT